MQSALNDLPRNAQSTIRNELTNLATRTIAASGEQFSCRFDFLGQRAKQGLQRIRAHLLHQQYPDPEPTFCDLTPSRVDMNALPAQRSAIDTSGYDFDSKPPLTVWLVSATRAVDVSKYLTLQTSGNGERTG